MKKRLAAALLLAAAFTAGVTAQQPGSAPAQDAQTQFKVTGEVRNPGVFEWKGETTVQAAIEAAGGTTDRFSLARSYITHPVKDKDGNPKTEKISGLKLTTRIVPGDTLVVGRKLM